MTHDCNNGVSMLNNMFLTMFYSWWIATSIAIVSVVYILVYKYCEVRGVLKINGVGGEDVHYDVTNYRKLNNIHMNHSALLLNEEDFEQEEL